MAKFLSWMNNNWIVVTVTKILDELHAGLRVKLNYLSTHYVSLCLGDISTDSWIPT